MSTKTSHRRKARRQQSVEARFEVRCPHCGHRDQSFSHFTTCTLKGQMK